MREKKAINVQIGRQVKLAREKSKLTQEQLANYLKVDQTLITKLENGTRNPSLSMVKKLAHGLGMQLKLEFIQTPAK